MNKSRPTCFVIGSDTLLIECARQLMEREFEILGVVSDAARIRRWTEQQDLRFIDQYGYAEVLEQQTFDYLFSITHLEIIPESVLKLPQKMAVNFHDGPLPAYAGLNAPAWAIINGEQSYGITWHEITSGVDQGRILRQVHFDVAGDETSLSINTKCFAAALESFPKLINDLAVEQVAPKPQDLSARSYFGKYKQPDAGGFIDWEQPAEHIVRLIRAMDFGDYPNPITTAKTLCRKGVLCLRAATVSAMSNSDAPAGTIVEFGETVLVAAGQGAVEVSRLSDLYGQSYSPQDAVEKWGLLVGDRFEGAFGGAGTPESAELAELSKQAIRRDAYWAERLAELEPAVLPPTQSSEPADVSTQTAFQEIVLPEVADSSDDVILAAFLLALGKCTAKKRLDVAFQFAEQSPIAEHAGYVAWTPLQVNLDGNQAIADYLTQVKTAIAELAQKGPWSNDLLARQPALSGLRSQLNGNSLPVTIRTDAPGGVRGAALTLSVDKSSGTASLHFDAEQLPAEDAHQFAGRVSATAIQIHQDVTRPLASVSVLSDEQRQQVLDGWNATEQAYNDEVCIHDLFESQAAERGSETALVFEDQSMSYAELNRRSSAVANRLKQLGCGPDTMVGVHVPRSMELVVATLGVLKAGAAYVPLDPEFPADRLAYMISDAKMPVVLSHSASQAALPECSAQVLAVDELLAASDSVAESSATASTTKSNDLAYVIYTSGSTGNPKGVMVEHRNATNFFVGMDEVIRHDPPGVWLAVTSLSFDISVLELLWTLTRGFKVVIHRKSNSESSPNSADVSGSQSAKRPMKFGLFMWGNDDAEGSAKYQLLIDGAKYFDENGFDSVWTPERHFAAFGGPYPNPAVTSAAVAAVTKRIAIRSGSIVSPLHHPVRIAEDWSVIDNLSDGRVGLSFAAGWQPNDFVIMPQNHANNKQIMLEQIDTVRQLWRGESVEFENPNGEMVPVATLPRPVQKELPVWLTTAGNPETYRIAGRMGLNVLTHLLGQSVDEVSEKIAIYREARAEAGLDPAGGQVTLMLHTFVGYEGSKIKELVREPLKDYLRSSMKLVLDFAWSFPAFKRPGGAESQPDDIDIKSLTEEEKDTILDFAFERYYETSGLFGTPEQCLEMINRCKSADVDEIACLLDFGVQTQHVMESLPALRELRDRANSGLSAGEVSAAAVPIEATRGSGEYSIASLIKEHKVTHFQCTPSMARMLSFDTETRQAFGSLEHMMVGGEPLTPALADDLCEALSGRLTNMYGPTETTIWSSVEDIAGGGAVTIGKPIANTQMYILDEDLQPVPPGVAGQLYIGGQGVVRGYLNRDELTAERFCENPFRAGERMYHTGDLAKHLPDGRIEFLGRGDHQVKIRGYRIELGEIEAAASVLEAVRDVAVLYKEPKPGDQRLVAYVVPAGNPPTLVEIRDSLRKDLPEYMLPGDLVILDEMPLTPNGKIDRKRLPDAQLGQQGAEAAQYVAPESDLEKTIASVWRQTLNRDSVGLKDNFFDLGGHSLLIVQVHQILKEKLEQSVSLTDLYRFPTIRALSDYISSEDRSANLASSVSRASRRRERMGLRRRRSRE